MRIDALQKAPNLLQKHCNSESESIVIVLVRAKSCTMPHEKVCCECLQSWGFTSFRVQWTARADESNLLDLSPAFATFAWLINPKFDRLNPLVKGVCEICCIIGGAMPQGWKDVRMFHMHEQGFNKKPVSSIFAIWCELTPLPIEGFRRWLF